MTPSQVVAILSEGKCPVHPRYAKKRQPRTACQNCWFLWFLKALRNDEIELDLGSE